MSKWDDVTPEERANLDSIMENRFRDEFAMARDTVGVLMKALKSQYAELEAARAVVEAARGVKLMFCASKMWTNAECALDAALKTYDAAHPPERE